MRKPALLLSVLAAVLAAGNVLPAAPEIKLMTVDIGRAYKSYWKTRQNEAKLRDDQKAIQEEIDQMDRDLKVLVDQFNIKREESENQVFSQEARDRATNEAQQMAAVIRDKQQQGQTYVSNRENQLRNRVQAQQGAVMTEVRDVILKIQKDKGANVVLDTSGPTTFGFPTVFYSDPAYDVTEEVITELNKTMPPGFKIDDPAPAPTSGN